MAGTVNIKRIMKNRNASDVEEPPADLLKPVLDDDVIVAVGDGSSVQHM